MKRYPLLALTALVVASAHAGVSTVRIRRDTVIPIVFEDSLSLRENRVGDSFEARIDGPSDFPAGTRLMGRISDIKQAHGDKPASMDLRFDQIAIQGQPRQPIRAVPISLDDHYVRHEADGRIVVREDVRKKENYVFGGAVGGFVLGTIVKKPLEGAIVGILGGIAAAETGKTVKGDVVVKRGDRLGAAFERDAVVEIQERDDRPIAADDRDSPPARPDRDVAPARTPSRPSQADIWKPWQYQHRGGSRRETAGVVSIRVGDRELRFSSREAPFRLGRTVMVPLQRAADQLRIDVDARTDSIWIESSDTTVKVVVDSRSYRVNGRSQNLSRAVVRRDGVIYVPVELLSDLTHKDVFVNGNRMDMHSSD